mmetsp:Transcript_21120/g.33750  ORF Transcript_21120/g.33750 Transcript_21120/m.33750 type:complete len:280 (+) Transcript_21120:2964-3803(+)
MIHQKPRDRRLWVQQEQRCLLVRLQWRAWHGRVHGSLQWLRCHASLAHSGGSEGVEADGANGRGASPITLVGKTGSGCHGFCSPGVFPERVQGVNFLCDNSLLADRRSHDRFWDLLLHLFLIYLDLHIDFFLCAQIGVARVSAGAAAVRRRGVAVDALARLPVHMGVRWRRRALRGQPLPTRGRTRGNRRLGEDSRTEGRQACCVYQAFACSFIERDRRAHTGRLPQEPPSRPMWRGRRARRLFEIFLQALWRRIFEVFWQVLWRRTWCSKLLHLNIQP